MKLKPISLPILILIMILGLSGSVLALTSDPAAFDEVWNELYYLDEAERANAYAEWRDRAEYDATLSAPEPTAAPVFLAGDIEEHRLSLPATDTPWLIHIEDFNLNPTDPDLVQIEIIDTPSGEGSVYVITPNDFIDQGGSITVDPYSFPPQVKINSGTTQLLHAPQFIMIIEAPIDRVVANASLPLRLLNFQGQRLDLDLQGDYLLDLSVVQLEELKIEASGYGRFKLSGNIDYASVDLNGSMELDATGLSTKKLHARLDGPMVAKFGDSEQSILEARDTVEIAPPNGDLIRLDG